jgi:hypothetical protein
MTGPVLGSKNTPKNQKTFLSDFGKLLEITNP